MNELLNQLNTAAELVLNLLLIFEVILRLTRR